jgi:hypothetical protein
MGDLKVARTRRLESLSVFTVIYTQTSERGVGVSLGAQLRARLIGAMEYVEQVLE